MVVGTGVGAGGFTDGGIAGDGTGGDAAPEACSGEGARDLDLPRNWDKVRPSFLRPSSSFWPRNGIAGVRLILSKSRC
jgi:hypothetical protein